MSLITQYLKDDGRHFIFTGPHRLDFYVPKKYLETTLASKKENFYEVFGVIPVVLRGAKGEEIEVRIMKCPSMIKLFGVTYTPERRNFFKEDMVTDYEVLSFYKGDKVMNAFILPNVDNLDRLLDYLIGAKIINYVSIFQLCDIFNRCVKDNNTNLNIPHIINEIIIGSVCRDPEKPEYTYGEILGKNPKRSPYGYRPAGNREIVARSSVATGIGFEDSNRMIINGLNTTAYGKDQLESPLENILTM